MRIHRLLRQTNDMLERLQTDFDKSLRHDLATVQTDLATVQSDLQLSDSKSDTTESDDQVRFNKILQVVKLLGGLGLFVYLTCWAFGLPLYL